VEFIKIEE
jgi:hypothetical protein